MLIDTPGTPVQNNLQELHALLHFLMPKIFKTTAGVFESWFLPKKGEKKAKVADKSELEPEAAEVLHEIIRPFFLRRTKEEVLKDLPPKSEVILYTGMKEELKWWIIIYLLVCIGMSAMQKKYYKWILTKDIAALSSNAKTTVMNNIQQSVILFPSLFI